MTIKDGKNDDCMLQLGFVLLYLVSDGVVGWIIESLNGFEEGFGEFGSFSFTS